MDQRITVITLGVASHERARHFYCEGLGWRRSSSSNDHITFLDMGGVVLALYAREALAEDAKVNPQGSGFGGVALAQNVASRAEVDAVLAAVQRAGGTLLKPAQEAFWGGYSGYFADPDGHPWEVAHNPHWSLSPEGKVILPD